MSAPFLLSRGGRIRTPGGGGAAGPSARIYAGAGEIQLPGGGYGWAGTSGIAAWDDAGYMQAYGSRPAGLFDTTAIVAIAPVAGRYRAFTHVAVAVLSPAVNVARPLVGFVWEYDNSGFGSNSEIQPAIYPQSLTSDPVWCNHEWIGPLDANGCVGVWTVVSTSPLGHDQLGTESYFYFEKIG